MSKKDDVQSLAVLDAQRALRDDARALIILVAGIDGSGRHDVINALSHRFDPRGVRVTAWSPESAPGQDRPTLWRHWRALPARDQVGLMLDGWYDRPVDAVLRGEAPDLAHLAALEAQLIADGALIVKLWVVQNVAAARHRIRKRLKAEARDATLGEQRVLAAHDAADAGLASLREQTGPWIMLKGRAHKKARRHALDAIITAVTQRPDPVPKRVRARPAAPQTRLATIDLSARVAKAEAKQTIGTLQAELARRVWAAHRRGQPTVMLLEGWDAAGKGGVIRRVTHGLDARLFQVVPVAAPNDEARARPYLWRFWRRLPRDGHLTIFDRSWYGRVLVERVEGFARRDEWQRAYAEINDFEAQLVGHGAALVKVWLHLSPQEQLRRFEARADTAHKQHKLTDEDWRNRDQWDDYLAATEDMLHRTDTGIAPWTVVASECKQHARITVLRALIDALAPR